MILLPLEDWTADRAGATDHAGRSNGPGIIDRIFPWKNLLR